MMATTKKKRAPRTTNQKAVTKQKKIHNISVGKTKPRKKK
jgi:hypothetical protein